MIKKWGLIWFGMIILSWGLIACSGGESDNSSNVEGESEVKLNFVHWVNEDVGKWEQLINEYEAENPGVKIESTPLVENMDTASYYKQLDLLASAGEKLDVVMFSTAYDLAKRVDAGLMAPINSFLDEEGIDINQTYKNSYSPIDGQYYGLPMKNVTTLVMLNKEHLDEAGLEIPTDWTWEDYKDYAKAMTTDEHYGSYLHSWHDVHSSLKLQGSKENNNLLKADGTSNTENPLVKESLKLRYQLEEVDKSSVPYSDILSQKLNYRQQFFTGEASMIPIASYMVTEWGSFTPDFEIAWAPWPKNNSDSEIYAGMGGDLIGIAESSEHKQEAYDFIRWMSTEGISDQGLWVPSWTEADLEKTLKKLVESTPKPEAIDMESLLYTLEVTNPTETFAPPSYYAEVIKEFSAEVERYLLGEQDIDTTMENIHKRVQAVIGSNK
ncbi:ABC transporter substrate-binding protein [Alkalihalobacillus sp. TS-13]|uniref:ABC transporter substrate-binding protein n=1 Tax=Alkalihalobacillus sp. TS-13 TaxID=2842455 RepID=UPI001C88571A|nr:extracellular solute-binding protein [Alkalihalobacillus sp. TS-13]